MRREMVTLFYEKRKNPILQYDRREIWNHFHCSFKFARMNILENVSKSQFKYISNYILYTVSNKRYICVHWNYVLGSYISNTSISVIIFQKYYHIRVCICIFATPNFILRKLWLHSRRTFSHRHICQHKLHLFKWILIDSLKKT